MIKQEVDQGSKLRAIKETIRTEPLALPGWTLQNDLLCYNRRVVLSKKSSLLPAILAEFHDSPVGGHGGFLKTYKRITSELYWEGLKADVKRYVDQCHICQ